MRYYGVTLDEGGWRVSWRDMAAMVAHLPSESALRRANGDGWSEAERLLAEVANNVAIVWWRHTDHSSPGNDEPPRALSPHERERLAARRSAPIGERMRRISDAYGYTEEVSNG